MRAFFVFLILAAQLCYAQTDIFGSDDTIKFVSPTEGSSYKYGDIVPIVIKVYDDWDYYQVQMFIGGSGGMGFAVPVRTFSGSGPYEFDHRVEPRELGAVQLMAFVDLSGENAGTSFAATVTINVLPNTPPIAIEIDDRWHFVPSPGLRNINPDSISVTAKFADDSTAIVSQPGFGVRYTPLSPGIVSIAEDGTIEPLSDGETLIRVEYQGFVGWTYVAVSDPKIIPRPYPVPRNLASEVAIERREVMIDTLLNKYVHTLTVTNTSALPIPASLMIVLDKLTDGVEITSMNAAKSATLPPVGAPLFRPYRATDYDSPRNLFMPGEFVEVDIEFWAKSGQKIDYNPIMYVSGSY